MNVAMLCLKSLVSAVFSLSGHCSFTSDSVCCIFRPKKVRECQFKKVWIKVFISLPVLLLVVVSRDTMYVCVASDVGQVLCMMCFIHTSRCALLKQAHF